MVLVRGETRPPVTVHTEVTLLMREQMPAMAAAAEMLHARTGLRVPEAEALLGRAAEV